MYLLPIIFICLIYLCSCIYQSIPGQTMAIPFRKDLDIESNVSLYRNITISFTESAKILTFGTLIITFLFIIFLHICRLVKFVEFSTSLSIKTKTTNTNTLCLQKFIFLFLYGLFLTEYEEFLIFLICKLDLNLHFRSILYSKYPLKCISRTLFLLLNLYIFHLSKSTFGNIISVIIFQNLCFSVNKSNPQWLSCILILLSNDVHQNPGPYSNSYFNFMNWNCNSIAKDNFHRLKLLEAQNSLYNYDIISLCETSLNDQVVLPDLNEYLNNEYTFISQNKPDNTRHGGVGLFYRNSLPLKIRNDLSFNESIVAELNYGRKKIFFTVVYRSPAFNYKSVEYSSFLSNLNELYAKIKLEKPYMTFFTGDFNAHSQLWYPDGISTPEGEGIENFILSQGLHQIISEPTHFVPNKNPTCIDFIITDQPNLILDSGTRSSPDNFCHHQIIYCKANFCLPPPPPYEREIWYYQRANKDLIQRSMTNFSWEQHLNSNPDPNWQVKEFTKIFLNIMSNFIPHEKKKFKPRDNPWVTKTLKTMIRKKNRLYKNYKKHGFQQDDKIRLDNFRIECQKAVESAKNLYLQNLGNKLNDLNTSKKIYWKILNKVMNRSKAPKIPPILVENTFILDCKEKAELFTTFFCKQCSLIFTNSVLPPLVYRTNARLNQIPISENDIVSLICRLNPNKATGSDGISAQMLLLCGNTVAIPLKIIFSNILYTGIYPNTWKLANVTPVHKKGDKQVIKNYRPISLLPICGKILEKVIFSHLYGFLTINGLITKKQSGFRPGDSTTNQLLDLIDTIHQSFDASPTLEVRAVFMDISKAFDKVWHKGLIFKLKQNGISGSLLELFKDYLSNRKQRVVLNGTAANFNDVLSGVPQGSVLGPLLFLIYINDLEINIKSQIRFFADDTMLYSIVKNPNISASELNQDLEIIHQWAYQWKMEFNPDPTKQATELLFSYKKKPPNHPPLFFNGNIVTKVDEHKHLGLILDKKLTFKSHIIEKISKAKKLVGIIKNLSKFLPVKTLLLIYKSLLRPHLDYCDIIFHVPPLTNGDLDDTERVENEILRQLMTKIESVQYQAALAITGTWQGTSRIKIYKELGLESLSDRRFANRLFMFFKIRNNITPVYLSEKIPRLLIQDDPNAIPNTFPDIETRTVRYKNTFFPNAISIWNNTIVNIQEDITLQKFKSRIFSIIRPIAKSIYGIHDPIGIHYLYQLRTGLSPLRNHKFRHKFGDTPTATCICNQDIEDNNHFLLQCMRFEIYRTHLIDNLNNVKERNSHLELVVNVDFLLNGHSRLSFSENKQVLTSTIKYIKDTKRFLSDPS